MVCLAACAAQQRPLESRVAGAVSPDDVDPGEDMFDCDATPGHYSSWSHAVGDSGQITGSLHFYAVRFDANWLPWATVLLHPKTGKPLAGVVAGRPRDRDVVLFNSSHQENGRERRQLLIPALPLGTDVPFALRWTPDKVEVQLAREPSWHTVPLVASPARVSLGCSTAGVVFHDISIKSPAPAS